MANRAIEQNTKALQDLQRTLEKMDRKGTQPGGGGSMSGRGGGGGGGGQGSPGMFSKQARTIAAGNLLASGGSAFAGMLGSAGSAAVGSIGSGLVSASRGGSFAGGGARAAASALGGVPIIGELSGAAPATRIANNAESRLNSLTNEVAAYGGAKAVTPRLRGFLAEKTAQQAKNIEEDQQANAAEIDKRFGKKGSALGGNDVVQVLRDILSAINGKSGGNPGGLFG